MSNPHPRFRTAFIGPAHIAKAHIGNAQLRPFRPFIGVAVITLLSIATLGCSGGEDAGPPRSTTVPPRLATTTITTSPSGTTAATATGTTPLVATTSTPTTATQTVDEAAQQILEVQNAYRAGMAAIQASMRIPVDPANPALEALLTGEMLTGWQSNIEKMRSRGEAARDGEQRLASITVRRSNTTAERATLETCEIDDGVVFAVNSDQVVNDRVSTLLVDAELLRIDGIWKISGRIPRLRLDGVQTCPET